MIGKVLIGQAFVPDAAWSSLYKTEVSRTKDRPWWIRLVQNAGCRLQVAGCRLQVEILQVGILQVGILQVGILPVEISQRDPKPPIRGQVRRLTTMLMLMVIMIKIIMATITMWCCAFICCMINDKSALQVVCLPFNSFFVEKQPRTKQNGTTNSNST